MTTPTVLACDDETFILRALQMKLSRAGLNVITAADGAEGWDKLNRTHVDLLITDLQMPRMDGLELIRQVRLQQEMASLPVILLTAKGFEYDAASLQQLYAGLVLIAKPFSPRELLLTVQSLLQTGETSLTEASPAQPAARFSSPSLSRSAAAARPND
ncbi:MAG: response regulator [Planctomycetaceae bacterium]|nr:response regulator [Planctomycetaceae bacterium]